MRPYKERWVQSTPRCSICGLQTGQHDAVVKTKIIIVGIKEHRRTLCQVCRSFVEDKILNGIGAYKQSISPEEAHALKYSNQ